MVHKTLHEKSCKTEKPKCTHLDNFLVSMCLAVLLTLSDIFLILKSVRFFVRLVKPWELRNFLKYFTSLITPRLLTLLVFQRTLFCSTIRFIYNFRLWSTRCAPHFMGNKYESSISKSQKGRKSSNVSLAKTALANTHVLLWFVVCLYLIMKWSLHISICLLNSKILGIFIIHFKSIT